MEMLFLSYDVMMGGLDYSGMGRKLKAHRSGFQVSALNFIYFYSMYYIRHTTKHGNTIKSTNKMEQIESIVKQIAEDYGYDLTRVTRGPWSVDFIACNNLFKLLKTHGEETYVEFTCEGESGDDRNEYIVVTCS